jgi:hypothetical protein
MYTVNHHNEFVPLSGGSYRVPETAVGNLLVGITQHANTCEGKSKKYTNVVRLNSINQPALLQLKNAFVAQRRLN